MMEQRTPFDHRPDPELGDALRVALDAGAHDAFVARVVARYEATRAAPPAWEVLSGWTRRGVVAAVIAAALAGIALGRRSAAPARVDVEDALSSVSGSRLPPAALLTAQRPGDATAVFASFEER